MKRKHKVGDNIYVDSSFYMSHGSDDFVGGLCKISKLYTQHGTTFVEVVERPGHGYNYDILLEQQKTLAQEFGKKRGFPQPDVDTPWIEPGDTVGHGW